MFRFTAQTLRNLFTGPATRPYPANPRDPFPKARGELVNDIDTCIFCSMCARACPSLCLEVNKKEGLWTWDPASCVYCGACVDACPTKCLSQSNTYRPPFREGERVTRQGTPPARKKAASAEE